MSIKRAFTDVFSSCNGPFLSCSAQAAQITGIESAIILNHLVNDFSHRLDAYIHPNYFGNANLEYIVLHDRIYFIFSHDFVYGIFDGILSDADADQHIELLEKNDLVKYHKIGVKTYFTIMYDSFTFQDVEKERLSYIEKRRLESLERKEKKQLAKLKKQEEKTYE